MERFIGRAKDLAFLKETYEGHVSSAVAIVGRRRIGKTRLIKEFIKDKKNLYIQFLNSPASINLQNLSMCIERQFGERTEFKNSIEFFYKLGELIKGDRYVIVFDEYPFMASKDEAFSSMLQYLIDHEIGESMVILSGSSVSMMEQEICDSSRPLFGRVHRYHLKEMGIHDCMEFHPDMSTLDQMRMYLTFGGVPMYYDKPKAKSYRTYIERYVLAENSIFRLEGEDMIRRELPHSDDCIEILDALANRCNTIPEIANVTKLDRLVVRKHLFRMVELNMVERVHAIAGSNVKPERYEIKDRMLAFHHFVIRRHVVSDDIGYDFDSIRGLIDTFLGRMFEGQCAKYVTEHYDVSEIGKWYGKVPLRDENGKIVKDDKGKVETDESDIDMAAYVRMDGSALELYGECKFTSDPIGFSDYNKLRERMSVAKVGANSRLIFFSRNGFSSKFVEYAKENKMILVNLDDMMN